MRHPPRSGLLAVGAAVALVGTAIAPVVTASGATPACTVDYSVTSQWDTGFQGAVKITNNRAALSGWSLTFDFANGQKVGQGWNAKWSQSATTVTAANESWNGALGSGASVSAGFLASWSGSNAVPTTFKLNGTTCNVDTEPSPTPTDPPPTTGTAPELHVSGNKLVDSRRHDTAAARRQPLRRRVHVRPGIRHLRRARRRRLGQGDRRLEGQHGPHSAQRGVLARSVQHQTGVRGRQLHLRRQGPGRQGRGARDDPARRTALEPRAVHRELVGLLGRARHLPEADAGRAVQPGVLVLGHAARSRTTRPSPSTCSTSPTRTARPPPPPRRGPAGRTAAAARASATRSPGCRTWSTRCAAPAPGT